MDFKSFCLKVIPWWSKDYKGKEKYNRPKKLIAYTWEVKVLKTALAFYSKEIIQKEKNTYSYTEKAATCTAFCLYVFLLPWDNIFHFDHAIFY